MSSSIKRVAIFLDIDGVLIDNEWDKATTAKVARDVPKFWKLYRKLPVPTDHAQTLTFRRAAARHFSPDAVRNLRELVAKVEKTAKVVFVISSDWRKTFSKEELKQYVFTNYKWLSDRIIDKIPDEPAISRGEQIAAWLEANSIDNYAILDDFDDGIDARHPGHFVHVDAEQLLTKKDCAKAATMLSSQCKALDSCKTTFAITSIEVS